MRVIKRDGRTVEYDRNKILIAIRKANAEVDTFERVNDDMIDGIVAGIENMKRDTMQVEDIQDIIEQKLMAAGKFDLAKCICGKYPARFDCRRGVKRFDKAYSSSGENHKSA